MFYFLHRQHPSRFAKYPAASWAIEAGRALIRVQLIGASDLPFHDLFPFSDVLQVFAN